MNLFKSTTLFKQILQMLLLCIGMQAVANTDSTILTLQNVSIINVKSGTVMSRMALMIKGGVIAKIDQNKHLKPAGVIIDLKGAYLMPGLIDAHVHVANSQQPNEETTYKHLNYFLRHGITTVRDAAGNASVLQKMHRQVKEGKIQAADIYYSAFMAGDWYYNRGAGIRKEPYTAWEQNVNPGDDLDKAMKAANDCGATGLKLYHSFNKEFLAQIVKAAKKYGLKTWGHAMMYPAKPHEVAAAGVDVISHIYMVESYSTDTLIRFRKTPQAYKDSVKLSVDISRFCHSMKKNHTILDPTLCVSYPREKWTLNMLKRVHHYGIKVAAGTDQIVDLTAPYPRLIDELSLYADSCGFSNAEALRTATVNAAETIGMQKIIGTIQKGKRADLIVLGKNPLSDIKNLKKPDMVIHFGRIVKL